MNLGFDFRSGLDAIPRALEGLVARINTIWGKQHDPEHGGHTAITATSIAIPDPLAPNATTSAAAFDPARLPKLRLNVDPVAPVGSGAALDELGDVLKLGPIQLDTTALPPPYPQTPVYTYIRTGQPTLGGGSQIVGDLNIIGDTSILGELGVNGNITAALALISLTLSVSGGATIGGILTLTTGRIGFPAVQVPSVDPNTLDDYEEGTWTPALLFGGAAVGLTYTARSGVYVKVGQQVTIAFRIELSAKGASAGVATVTGLPFTAISATPQPSFTGTPIGVTLAGLTSPPTMRLNGNTAVIDLFDWGATGVATMDDTNFANTSVLAGSLTYRAAA